VRRERVLEGDRLFRLAADADGNGSGQNSLSQEMI
jgi:hypothetical protein